MEHFGSEIVFPTTQQICEINRRMIEEFGGLFLPPNNLNNSNALEYILTAISFPIGNYHLYPTLKEKAAAIAYHIISRHIFRDGNKRTAIHTAWEFLRSNQVKIFLDLGIVELSGSVAENHAGFEELLKWFHNHQEDSKILQGQPS